MRNTFSTRLRVEMSRTRITVLRTSGWIRTHDDLLGDIPLSEGGFDSSDQLTAKLDSLLAEHNCSRLPATVILADELVRLFMVTPPRNAARLQDCRTAAEMRFRSLYGDSTADWQLQADWNATQSFLACAMPHSLLSVLQRTANAHRLTLVEIMPRFIAHWNRWRKNLNGAAWFGVAYENQLTLGATDSGRLSAVRSTLFPADGWQDQHRLAEYLNREALRLNLAPPLQLQVCGQIPGQWTNLEVGSMTCIRLDGTSASNGSALARSRGHQ